MKTTIKRSESGQVLVLIILSIVGVLGFAALAIDGSMIYSERRVAQNAADAAAYASAASLSQEIKNYEPGQLTCANFNDPTNILNSDPSKKQLNAAQAVARAQDNTFSIVYKSDPASVTTSDNAVWMVCGLDDVLKLTYIDVHVRITRQVSTSLMHLFYNGPAINTVDSIVRVYPPTGVVIDTVILALCTNGDTENKDGLTIGGSTTVKIVDGKMVSNCKITNMGVNAKYDVPAGINYYTSEDITETNLVPPTTVSQAPPLIFPFTFSDTLKGRCNTTYAAQPITDLDLKTKDVPTTITPGKYSNIKLSKGSLKMLPGLYCVYGDIDINSTDTVIEVDGEDYAMYAKDVTIYMPDTAGAVTINGSSRIHLSAPTEECFKSGKPCSIETNGPPVKGLLLWYDPVNNTITLNGSNVSLFEGTIAAPYSTVRLLGTSDVNDIAKFGVQVIADDVEISGNSTVDVTYNAKKLFSTDTQLGLER